MKDAPGSSVLASLYLAVLLQRLYKFLKLTYLETGNSGD